MQSDVPDEQNEPNTGTDSSSPADIDWAGLAAEAVPAVTPATPPPPPAPPVDTSAAEPLAAVSPEPVSQDPVSSEPVSPEPAALSEQAEAGEPRRHAPPWVAAADQVEEQLQSEPAPPESAPPESAPPESAPPELAPSESAPSESAPPESEAPKASVSGSTAEPFEQPQPMPLPRVIAVANQKGGVGKTTTTVNLAACLAEQGYRTLLVDLDPQANASTGLGLEPRELDHSIYHVLLHDQEADSCIEPTEIKNLFVLPSSLDLAGAEIELVALMSREHRLRMAIESVLDDYDYVLIDCPPSLGLLTINALTAAKEVLVPIQCEYYALEGLGQLMRNVGLVKSNLNPSLQISHIVLVMFDPRTKLAGQVVDEVRGHFGLTVCENVIPRTVRLSEAPSFGQPITTFDSGSRGAAAYRAVAQEVTGGQA